MPENQEKIKEYLDSKKVKIATKIEKTPMEKFFVFFLILISATAVVLGYFQFKQNLEGPLALPKLEYEKGKIQEKYANANISTSKSEMAELQQMDSDLDGLSDYSERYIYKTNAYLEDSDGDGIWDRQEITAGTDPNCPTGQDCRFEDDTVLPQDGTETDININNITEIQNQLLAGEISLQDVGIDNPQLEELLQLIKQGQGSDGSIEIDESEKEAILENVKNLTPDQVRQELINQGMDQAILDQVDDETLMRLFSEVFN